jgi:hypothetical protein
LTGLAKLDVDHSDVIDEQVQNWQTIVNHQTSVVGKLQEDVLTLEAELKARRMHLFVAKRLLQTLSEIAA